MNWILENMGNINQVKLTSGAKILFHAYYVKHFELSNICTLLYLMNAGFQFQRMLNTMCLES